jgi:hypothetical protein
MSEEEPKGLKFVTRDGGARPSEAKKPIEKETKEELEHAITNTKSSNRRKG